MENKTIDVAMELSKNEIVSSINEICQRNNLPLCLLHIILSNILNEVDLMSNKELEKNMNNYIKKERGENNGKNKRS